MIHVLTIIIYLTIGFGCYCAYWRFTNSDYESKFDQFWGYMHFFLWPLTLFVGLLGLLTYCLELLTIKLIRKRRP